MSRVNLVAAMPSTEAGADPFPIDLDDPRTTPAQRRAHELIGMMADGPTGQGQLLAMFGTQLTVGGIGWLVVEPASDDPLADTLDDWNVYSGDEIRSTNSGDVEVRIADREWRPLHPNALVVKVWRKHPRRQWEPDAPTRAALPILREIDLLQKHIHATAQSRLAGAGILAIPTEAVFPPGQGPQASQQVDPDDENLTAPEDSFVDTLIDAMTTPLADRGSAAAVVPLVVKVPGDLVDKMKHLTFATPFDDRVQDLLQQAIKRLALGLDIPPEVLLGVAGVNHWSAWQVAEEAITLHIEPMSEMVVNALTIGFLHPALEAEGYDPSEVTIWYDTAALRTKPDKTKSAIEAYDRIEISGASLLRELGMNPEDIPSYDEKRERLLLKVASGAPTLAPAMLAELGYLSDAGVSDIAADVEVISTAEEGDTTEQPAPDVEADQGAPATEPSALALLAAADLLVHRALERAGARLRNAARKRTPDRASQVACDDLTMLHTILDVTTFSDLGALLDGAWSQVPAVAARLGYDPEALTVTLDAYTRALLATGQVHDADRLSAALGIYATV